MVVLGWLAVSTAASLVGLALPREKDAADQGAFVGFMVGSVAYLTGLYLVG